VPRFTHVVVIVFENKEANEVLGNPQAPTFNRLARRYAVLANYFAVSHPSLPNYLALVSGSTQGIKSDCTRCIVDAPNLADTLAQKGLAWKTYAEGLPRPGFTGDSYGRYVKKHNPFLYFRSVLDRPERLQRIVPLAQLRADLRSRRLPPFSLVVPDVCHDMHECPVAAGDAWLGAFVKPLLASRELRHGVVFVVFDEGDTDAGGGGHVAALALGLLVRAHSRFLLRTSHYGLLRTIEDAWRLPRLGNSRSAPPITRIWK
jgi:phospholipase C